MKLGNGAVHHRANKGMIRAITNRIILSGSLGVIIALAFNTPIENISDTLFTVLGIVYSIVMSLLITFSTTEIKNNQYRKTIKKVIDGKIKLTTIDFFIPVLFYILRCSEALSQFHVNPTHCFIGAIIVSLISLTRVFFYIRNLNNQIEERILEEKKKRDERIK